MPPQITRGHFLRHRNAILPGTADQRPFMREWNAKTPAQKTEWLERFHAAEAADLQLVNAQNTAATDVATVDNQAANLVNVGGSEDDYQQFFDDIAQARTTLEQLRLRARTARTRWDLFRVQERTHPQVNPQAAVHATAQATARLQEAQRATSEQGRLERMRATPPVPNDPNTGVARLPARWVINEDALRYRTLEHQKATNDVGMAGFYSGMWEPYKSMGDRGGMGETTLWLHFDDNDVVIDVSFPHPRCYQTLTDNSPSV
jgi:hypothetical protein